MSSYLQFIDLFKDTLGIYIYTYICIYISRHSSCPWMRDRLFHHQLGSSYNPATPGSHIIRTCLYKAGPLLDLTARSGCTGSAQQKNNEAKHGHFPAHETPHTSSRSPRQEQGCGQCPFASCTSDSLASTRNHCRARGWTSISVCGWCLLCLSCIDCFIPS